MCSAGWTGFSCGELDLLPATRGAGYRREGYSSWGGSAVQSEEDSNTWVMCVTSFLIVNLPVLPSIDADAPRPHMLAIIIHDAPCMIP